MLKYNTNRRASQIEIFRENEERWPIQSPLPTGVQTELGKENGGRTQQCNVMLTFFTRQLREAEED